MHTSEEASLQPLHLQDIHRYVERLLFHPVLQDEKVTPAVSPLQVFLGSLVLSQTELSIAVKKRIIAAMVLMYHGLDLHESIHNTEHKQTKRGQLTILGGAWLSSLFYRLLAEAERIDLISIFSEAVSRINEAKSSLVALSNERKSDDSSYLKLSKTIQGGLAFALTKTFVQDHRIVDFVEQAILADVYDRELIELESQHRSASSSKVYQNFFDTLAHLQTLCIDLFDHEAWRSVKSFFLHAQDPLLVQRVVEGG